MKKIYFIAAIIICLYNKTMAQTDYCKDITKTLNGAGDVATYRSPLTDFIHIDKGIWVGHDGTTSLLFYTAKRTADYNAGGLFVTFADGTMWKDEHTTIDCSYISADAGYGYTGASAITDDEIAQFKTKKIVKVQITNVVIPVDDAFATKFMAYVNCIDAIKK